MRVLVTDANNRVALAVVRALGRDVVAVEQRRFARRVPAAFLSRGVVERHVLPDLRDGFVEALAKIRADVVIPVSTNVLLAVARERHRFARVPVPDLATIRRANDKNSVLAVARRAGVPIPRSWAPESDEDLDGVAAALRFPAVVKMRDDAGTYLDPGERYRFVGSAEELYEAWRLWDHPVVQEKIEGEGYGCGFLAREGELLAAVCHRRVREYPIGGGPSAMCESLEDERLVGHARALARELRWTGVAMAEFKREADGGYRLLEINPRFWGSLPLALKAGVNFPQLLCRMAMGEPAGSLRIGRAGARVRFLTLDLPAAARAPRRNLGGFLRDLIDPRVSDGILDPADLRASVAYLVSRLVSR